MPANVEIKARVRDLAQLKGRAEREPRLCPPSDRYFLPCSSWKAEALSQALGVQGVVKKERPLYLVGQTRVHVDHVEGLGNFVELEAMLQEGQSPQEGEAIAWHLMRELGIEEEEDLVSGAYLDLLLAGGESCP